MNNKINSKIVLPFLLLALGAIVWVKFLSPSKDIENVADTHPDIEFKEVSLDLQPIKTPDIDRPTQLKFKLLEMLKKERFTALDKSIEAEAIRFDKGELSESDFDIIISSLAPVDPELEQSILNWISHSESWAAYLVAARYFETMSFQWRGGAYWSKVPQPNRQKFNEYQALAKAVSAKAKQNNNRDVLWYSDKIGFANQGSSDNEMTMIREALEKFPESIVVHHAAIAAQNSKWGGDESFRQQLIRNYAAILDKELHDGGPTINRYRAEDAADKKDYISAIREIRVAIQQSPNRLFYYSKLANYYYKTEQYGLALAAIDTTLKHRSNRGGDLLLRANILLRIDKPERAIDDLETLLSFSPMHKEANTQAFSAYAKLGKRQRALDTLENAGYFTQHNPRELSRQGFFARYDLKDLELATDYYNRVLELDPTSSAAHYAFASLYGEQSSCEVVKPLHEYLKSCSSAQGEHWCKPRYKNWAISSVSFLKEHKKCPEVFDYQFDYLF